MISIPAIDSRPSDYEYAIMSRYVYNTGQPTVTTENEDKEKLTTFGWNIFKECKGFVGYYGIIFRDEIRKQFVLAHHGTEPGRNRLVAMIKTLWEDEDIAAIFIEKSSGQMGAAVQYATYAYELLEDSKYQDYHLSFTGYYLGGTLAEISAFYLHSESALKNYVHVNAVTFDSPGSSEIIQKSMFNNISRNDILLEEMDIVNYLTYPNIVNIQKKKFGTVYFVNVYIGDDSRKGWLNRIWSHITLSHTTKPHTIDNIVEWFKQCSNEKNQRFFMTDWPLSLGYKKFFQMAYKHSGVYKLKMEDKELEIQHQLHWRHSEDHGQWNVLPLNHFCQNTQLILKSFFKYSFKATLKNFTQSEVNDILCEFFECCSFPGSDSQTKFVIVDSHKLNRLILKHKYTMKDREAVNVHHFRYFFTKFMADNLDGVMRLRKADSASLLTGLERWWPMEKKIVPGFVSRKIGTELIVEKLKRLLKSDNKAANVVITGIGGIGKTTTAIWFAQEYQNNYDHIIWLNCGELNIERSLWELAEALSLKINVYKNKVKRIEFIASEIYEHLKLKTCLFIFDSVDDSVEHILNVLPSSGNRNHKSLITSRYQNSGLQSEECVLELDVFCKEEAEQFLKLQLQDKIDDEGNESYMRMKLVEEMSYLPLALQIAVSTINNLKNLSISYYLEQVKECSVKFLLNNDTDPYHLSLNKSLQISINHIVTEKCGKLASEILNVLSFTAPEDITNNMIVGLIGEGNLEFNVDMEMQLLQDYYLVNSSWNGNYNIHRLLQEVVRMRLEVSSAKAILNRLLPYLWKPYCKYTDEYKSHYHVVWKHVIMYDDLVDKFWNFFEEFVKQQSHKSNRNTSLEFLKSSVHHLDRILGPIHETTYTIRYNVGIALLECGKYDEYCIFWENYYTLSESFVTEVEFESEAKPEDKFRRFLLAVKFGCGLIKEKQGKLKEAVEFYNQVAGGVEDNWTKQYINPIKIEFGSTVEDTEILISSPIELDCEFPTEIQLQSKIVTLLVSMNELEEAFEHMEVIMCTKYNPGSFDNINENHITIAGLKLLHRICNSKIRPEEIGEKSYKLFMYLCDKLVYWSHQYFDWFKLMYWNSIAGDTDSLAVQLIEFKQLEKIETVYSMVHNIQKCIICIEIETGTKFGFPNIGSEVISKLEQLDRTKEANEIGNIIAAIKKFADAGDVNVVKIFEDDNLKTDENQSSGSRNYLELKGISENELVTFKKFDCISSPQNVTKINFQYVEFYKYDLVLELNQYPNLESVILEHVAIIGECTERAYLPCLKVFVISVVEKKWYGISTKYGDSSLINRYSLFYKSAENKDWKVEDLNSLELIRYKVVFEGQTKIEINQLEKYVEFCLKDEDTDEIFKSINFPPEKLILKGCKASFNTNIITLFCDTLKELILHEVTFKGDDISEEMEIELSESLLKYFPYLETLHVVSAFKTPISLIVSNLPLKLTKLKLESATLITEFNENSELDTFTNNEVLKDLVLYWVTFKSEEKSKIELSERLLKYFPSLETLDINAYGSTPLNLIVNNMPVTLRKLKLESITCITTAVGVKSESIRSYNDMKQVVLKNVAFKSAKIKVLAENELKGESFLQHFPNLETFEVNASESAPISINIEQLPLNLTRLKLSSTQLIYTAMLDNLEPCENTESPKPPKIISLYDVALPYSEEEKSKLFRTLNCETVFIVGSWSKPVTPSDIENLVKINSVKFICIEEFDWISEDEDATPEIVLWMESIGVPREADYFCIRRIEGVCEEVMNEQMWKGNGLDLETFVSLEENYFNELSVKPHIWDY